MLHARITRLHVIATIVFFEKKFSQTKQVLKRTPTARPDSAGTQGKGGWAAAGLTTEPLGKQRADQN